MNRLQLIKKVEQHFPHYRGIDFTAIVNKVFYEINHALLRKDHIDIRDFGRFTVVKRKARVGRNAAKDFEPVYIPPRWQIKFKAGKKVAERLNEKNDSGTCEQCRI